jgi:hypothetical protein
MSVDYIARLKAEKRNYFPLDGTDKTDKTTSVSFVSCPLEEKKSLSPKQDEPENVVANDATPTSWRWLLHFTDRNPLIVSFSPEASHAEVLADYPDAVAAEPADSIPDTGQPDPMTQGQETAIRGGLDRIGETDPAVIGEVLDACLRDVSARGYYLGRGTPKSKGDA